ncbi:hypothetical protein [Ectobacillus ponti]|uniref:Uncharacterized protein n=1 Tax=Ectobacillus ponti TaxID=2961894 RepID=A0AA42BR59_9BACI|nr:hypothetical protein [Ectobacillus ponti]MCP8967078.1 hypothetical protein [Ectobacillus ponti]
MSLKKKAEVRTGKMARELMLADEEVSASLIMVYSENGVNAEIKIEGLHPKSNEELFLSGKVDWNRSVIYKIVDFTGKAEVGKVMLTEMKKNNVTLQIERVMWSKDKQGEAAQEENALAPVHTPAQEIAAPKDRVELAAEPAPKAEEHKPAKPQPAPAPQATQAKPQSAPAVETSPQPTVTAASLQQASEREAVRSALQQKYDRLLDKAKGACLDYSLGLDLDDSIEALTDELREQGVSFTLDADIMDAVQRLRQLKEKGIDPKKLLHLL